MSYGDKTLLSYLRKAELQEKRVVIAFDGFVDEIKKVVRCRNEKDEIVFFKSRQELLAELGDEACNKDLELVTVCRKMGGSAAIAANALATAGVQVSAWVTAGTEQAFDPLADKARLHSVGQPPLTWAIEFESGKVMLSDHAPLDGLNWETLRRMDSFRELKETVSACDILILTGYSLLRHGQELYEHMLNDVVRPLPERPQVLMDLADVSRKSKKELLELRRLLQAFGQICGAAVLMNRNEAAALERGFFGEASSSVRLTAGRVGELLHPCGVVLHTAEQSVSCVGGTVTQVFHPRAERAVVKTGCGDHFCAGYCLGQLLRLPCREKLQISGAVARYYIEHGSSPTLADIVGELGNRICAKDGPYRMIAMDFDGTILDARHQIPDGTWHVLRQAKEAGYLICACTGRSYIDTMRLLGAGHCFDYAITSNGGDVHDLNRNAVLEQHTIDRQASFMVMDVLDRHELYYEAYIKGQPWTEHRKVALLRRYTQTYADYLAGGGKLVQRTEALRQELQKGDTAVTKFYVIADSSEMTELVRQELHGIPGISCTSSGARNIEVLAQGIDKALALRFVAETANISMDQVLALGDGENDTQMLLHCGCGVAMENADQELKRLVSYVCPPCSQEGAADAIKYFCFA